MKRILKLGSVMIALAFCLSSLPVFSDEIESSIARGGRLYDKWYKEKGVQGPAKSHPAYPADKKYADKPGDNWRCKECHGWDTMGVDGAYASGSHHSGIKGVNGMAGADNATIVAAITNDTHQFAGKLSDEDLTDLANFIGSSGIDYDDYIDRESKTVKGGDAARGAAYFNTICANCHGKDGYEPSDMSKPLGAQMSNPWEVMHKVLNGQPDENMPALRALDHQVVVDILAHIATLPKE